jgi:hypothetical protein
MKKNILFIITASVIVFTAGKAWKLCTQLYGHFYNNTAEFNLHLQDVIYNDSTQSVLLVRVFHNKIVEGLLDIFRRYTMLIDIRFFISFLSFIGFVGILFAIWYIFILKKKKLIVVFLLLLLIPLGEILLHPNFEFGIKFFYLIFPFMAFSLYGHYQYLNRNMNKWTVLFYICLIVISIGFLSFFPDEFYNYCVKS